MMVTPVPPITPSSLDCFVTCGLQYYHKYVAKDLPQEPPTPQQAYGDRVHKAFEHRLDDEKPLPPDLVQHEPFLARLEARAGVHWCEAEVALGKDLAPTRYDDPNRFWRGKIDFRKVDRDDPRAVIVDYKTGKPFDKWTQLGQYALHTFAQFPKVNLVDARFYWTQTATVTRKVWGREDISAIWALITPDLKQYTLAHKSDVWQARPSGLCYGYCSFKSCDHWHPPRRKS